MSATAAYQAEVYITTSSSTPSSSDLLATTDSADWEMVTALIDVTAFDSGGEQTQIGGIMSGKVSVGGFLSASNTAQGRLLTASGDRSTVYVHYYPQGHTVAGYKRPFKVASFKFPSGVKEAVKYTCEMQSTGAQAAGSTF